MSNSLCAIHSVKGLPLPNSEVLIKAAKEHYPMLKQQKPGCVLPPDKKRPRLLVNSVLAGKLYISIFV